jgi:hypothetical protein
MSKRKCFEGQITDNEASLLFIGFTQEQQVRVQKFRIAHTT